MCQSVKPISAINGKHNSMNTILNIRVEPRCLPFDRLVHEKVVLDLVNMSLDIQVRMTLSRANFSPQPKIFSQLIQLNESTLLDLREQQIDNAKISVTAA
jgi:hypothetical protein